MWLEWHQIIRKCVFELVKKKKRKFVQGVLYEMVTQQQHDISKPKIVHALREFVFRTIGREMQEMCSVLCS